VFVFPVGRALLEQRYIDAVDWTPGGTVTVTGIITALVVGLIVGALGRLVVPGRQNIPIWLTMVIGVVAALLGTVIANAVGISTDTPGVDWGELLVQVLVAAVGVALVVGVSGRGRRAL
jgi:uncharacterized membrane protein YeaQ/YmgE (transglycosylase-associated protein family)